MNIYVCDMWDADSFLATMLGMTELFATYIHFIRLQNFAPFVYEINLSAASSCNPFWKILITRKAYHYTSSASQIESRGALSRSKLVAETRTKYSSYKSQLFYTADAYIAYINRSLKLSECRDSQARLP